MRPASFSLPAVCVIMIAGCGPVHPQTVSVRGRITLNGGDWPTSGRLYFTVVEPASGFPRHPGMAEFDRSGRFVAQTWEAGDGLMPGEYKVHVECWKTPPRMEGPPPESHVPPKYQSGVSSDLTLSVSPTSRGEDVTWNIVASP
jgi:hypothetical protein